MRMATTAVLALFVLAGCGGSDDLEVAEVRGKLIFEGKPVTEGSVSFTPMGDGPKNLSAGKSAGGEVGSDGTFVLATYDEGDGAVVGKHAVNYSAPDPVYKDVAEGEKAPPPRRSPFEGCGFASEKIVEVKAGEENIFEFELTRTGSRD